MKKPMDLHKAFTKFLLNPKNEELINEYEETMDEMLSGMEDAICPIYTSINNISSIKFDVLLCGALQKAVVDRTPVLDVLDGIRNEYSINNGKRNDTLQIYFNEVSDIYNRNNNNYDLEYCEENRERLLTMNLKSVIAEAKKYQGLGVDLEDLIGAGNEGLCRAWDKYDPARAKLKETILDVVKKLPEEFDYQAFKTAVEPFLKYGAVRKCFEASFHPDDEIYDRQEVLAWVNKNITNAKFNSVATMWIRAYIHIELNDNSRLVKKPKIEICRDKERDGYYSKEKLLCIDRPAGPDSDTPLGDILDLNTDDIPDYERDDAYRRYKKMLDELLTGVKPRDRGILMKKFGIGLPRPMQPDEISEQEGLSVARISQILQDTIIKMQENAIKYDVEEKRMMEMLEIIQHS